MDSALAIGFISLSQTAFGILGNVVLLCHFILNNFTGLKARPTDLIVKHLTWANFMLLLCKGITQTMTAFSQTHFLHGLACKLVLYFLRVARGVSLGSTCLLSIIQGIMISPRSPKWAQLKSRVPKVIDSSLGLCWGLQLTLNAFVPMAVTNIEGKRNLSVLRNLVYCAAVESHSLRYLYAILLASMDVICLGLMMWASGSMVFFLLKHKQRVQHIHRSLSTCSSPETRATRSILALVSSFVLFYIASVILTLCFAILNNTSQWLANTNQVLGTCFSTFCPFLLLRHYTSISGLCCNCSYQKINCLSIVKGNQY